MNWIRTLCRAPLHSPIQPWIIDTFLKNILDFIYITLDAQRLDNEVTKDFKGLDFGSCFVHQLFLCLFCSRTQLLARLKIASFVLSNHACKGASVSVYVCMYVCNCMYNYNHNLPASLVSKRSRFRRSALNLDPTRIFMVPSSSAWKAHPSSPCLLAMICQPCSTHQSLFCFKVRSLCLEPSFNSHTLSRVYHVRSLYSSLNSESRVSRNMSMSTFSWFGLRPRKRDSRNFLRSP